MDFNEPNVPCPLCSQSARVGLADAAGVSLAAFMRGKQRWGTLHGHSEFSLLDGAARVNDIVHKAKAMGQDFIAVTDHGNLFGVVKIAQEAKKVGIKHIVGCEFYISPVGRSRFDKEFKKGDKVYHHLVVLAKNKAGYQNLCRLSSIGYDDGFYRNPRIDKDILLDCKEGLIVTSSCVGGSIPSALNDGDIYRAEKEMEWYMNQFGDDFYVELQDHKTEYERFAFEGMRTLARTHGAKTVVTTDAHYLNADDEVAHDCLLCIGTGQLVDQAQRTFQFTGQGFHYMSEDEVRELFPHDIDAIYRAGEIADKCEDEVIEFGEVRLPYFAVPDDQEFQAWRQKRGASQWVTL